MNSTLLDRIDSLPSPYHFVTRWQFDAPIEAIWDILADTEQLPSWWEGFLRADVRGPGKRAGVGRITDCAVRGSLPYVLHFTLEVTEALAPNRLVMRATGDLEGRGEWLLINDGAGTAVTFYWDVRLTRPLLAALGHIPLLRRWLEKSHDAVMARGYRNLQRKLAAVNRTMAALEGQGIG